MSDMREMKLLYSRDINRIIECYEEYHTNKLYNLD